MTFLNPLVLFGLIAAAIPLILHLLNLRKLQTIDFSTLTFLKELQQTKIRRLKIRQILLLVIRTLIVVLIVLTFARPAIRGTLIGGFGSHAYSSVVFILDDSFSMLARDEHGELFRQAKESAARLLDLLKEGDEATLIKLSDLPRITVDPPTHDFGALRTMIGEAQVSSIRRPVSDAVLLASKTLKASHNANKEVYLLSDMQQTLFSAPPPAPQEGAPPEPGERGQTVFLVPQGGSSTPNTGIDSVEVLTTILEKDKPVRVYASVRNYSNTAAANLVISAYLDGVKMSQSNVSMEAYGSASVQLTVTPKKTGFLKGFVELENDAIEPDNRRYFSLFIPGTISVATLSASDADVKFVLQALKVGGGTDLLFSFQSATPQKFPLLDLKNTDVLICSNIPLLGAADADRIAGFVERGGGLIIFPGPSMQLENINRTLLATLGIPPAEQAAGQDSGLVFQNVDLDHPVFATVFEKEQPGTRKRAPSVESPSIRKFLKRQAGKKARTIITLTDGSVFLSEHEKGAGKILMYSVPPTLAWSDFPLKGIFAPLVYRSVMYVSPWEEHPAAYLAGSEPLISVRPAPEAELRQAEPAQRRFTMVAPDGSEEILQTAAEGARTVSLSQTVTLRSGRLTLPGFYEVKQGSTAVGLVTVNIDSRESDTRRATNADMENFWKRTGIDRSSVRELQAGEELASEVLQSRFGIELWKHAIALALLLALLEMLIARDSRQETQPR